MDTIRRRDYKNQTVKSDEKNCQFFINNTDCMKENSFVYVDDKSSSYDKKHIADYNSNRFFHSLIFHWIIDFMNGNGYTI